MVLRDGGFYAGATTRSTNLYLSRGNDEPRPILELNKHYKDVEFGKQVRIEYAYEGTKLSSCALLPPDWSPEKRYPVIVNVYPGVGRFSGQSSCFDDNTSFFNPYNSQILASKGYIIFYPAAPTKLIVTKDGPIAKMPDVILAGVDALIAQGYADEKRLGLYGFSQGGFAAPWILTRTKRFKAAVALHGAADYASEYLDPALFASVLADDFFTFGDAIRYEDPSSDFFIGKAPWEDPAAYTRNSPTFNAGTIDTPLLLIASDFDAFPSDQYEEMFTALGRQGKDTNLALYWGEGHGVMSPANLRDMWTRIERWYGARLGARQDR
jgi:dipeptidyl aminopeptidase/acylaminoacyl peptidase